MKIAIRPTMLAALFLAAMVGAEAGGAQSPATGPTPPHGRAVPSPGKWQNPVLAADSSLSATLKARPLLKIDITVPPDADDAGWLQMKFAVHGEGLDRAESPKWLRDGAPGKAGIDKVTLSWDTSNLSAKLPANPSWFKIELVNQGDRARTIYVDNLRCEAPPRAGAAAGKLAVAIPAGPTPFPANDEDWPGKGVIRTFGFMVGDRKAFWARRQQDQGAVVFVGDSLTGGWKNLDRDFPKLKVANRGLGGDVSRGVLFRFQEDVLDLNPKAVVICIGNNDLTAMGRPGDMLSNLADAMAMAEAAKPGIPVVLCSIPSSANPAAPVKADDRKAMNEGIRKMASEHKNTRFCDVYAATANADGSPTPESFADDRLHLSARGHAKWAELLAPIFAELKLQYQPATQGDRSTHAAPGTPERDEGPKPATEPAAVREDVRVGFSAKGVEFRAGKAGPLTLQYPALVTKTASYGIANRTVDAQRVVAKYEGGAELTIVNNDGVLDYRFAGLPGDVTDFRFEMEIPLTFNSGGSWQIGVAAGKFPLLAAEPPFLFKGEADSFRITDPAGNAVPLKLPGNVFQQLQDNRKWNYSAFGWKWFTPKSDSLAVTVFTKAKEAALKAEEERRRQLWVKDKSGQLVPVDFSRQLKSPDEITAYFSKANERNRLLIGADVPDGPGRALLLKTGADYIRLGWGFMAAAQRDMKEIRDLQAKGVHVAVGLGSHYPPGGFTQYKDAYFVDNFGNTGEGQTTKVVYGGSDWPQYSRASTKLRTELEKEFAPFLRTLKEQGQKNVVAVRVDNEPGYFWLQDRYYDFHPDAIAMSRQWLADRYKTIAALNDTYGTDYASFDKVDIPRDMPPVKSIAAWLDQRRANVHIVRDFLQWEKKLVRRETPGLPVTVNSGAMDWWHLWRLHDLYHCTIDLDIVGIDIYQDQYGQRFVPGYSMDTGIGVAAGRDVHVLEHSVYDKGHLPPASLDQRLDMFRSLYWTFIGHGARGLLAWGDSLGENERVQMIAETVQTVKQCELGLYRQTPRRMAVVVDADSLFYHGGMGDKSPVWIQQSFTGWHAALRRNHYEADVVFADQIREGIPKQYHTLIMAVPVLMDQPLSDRLKAFASDGGMLVAESRFAELDRSGKPVDTAPGFGLDAVFGVKTDKTLPVPTTIALAEGKITSRRYSTRLEVKGATVLARTSEGTPGITSHDYGRGTAVFIATSVGDVLLDDNGNDALSSFLARLVRQRHPDASMYRASYEGAPFVDVSMLKKDDDKMFVLTVQPNFGKPIVLASETVLHVKKDLVGPATTAYLALPETGTVSPRGMEFQKVPLVLDAERGEYDVKVGAVSSAALVQLTRVPRQ